MAVLSGDSGPHPAALETERLLQDCDVRRTRGSGPGGQHRNKVETAVVITHRPTGVIGQASERRSQRDNRRQAISRLRINLAVGFRQKIDDLATFAVSRQWQSRTASGRIDISPAHERFPALLAEALDVLEACEADAARAGKLLGCSASQLIKLLKKEPAAFRLVNRVRQQRGLPAYR